MRRETVLSDWKEIRPAEVNDNVFETIGTGWMLITAGTSAVYNTMTASWGAFGVLWGKNVTFCFVRPSRYTYEFMERTARYTLSFFPEEHRQALSYCGSRSGRNGNKAEAAGLTPLELDEAVSFGEARLVLVCRTLYTQDLDPVRFLDPQIMSFYRNGDFHRMYVGELERCLIRSGT